MVLRLRSIVRPCLRKRRKAEPEGGNGRRSRKAEPEGGAGRRKRRDRINARSWGMSVKTGRHDERQAQDWVNRDRRNACTHYRLWRVEARLVDTRSIRSSAGLARARCCATFRRIVGVAPADYRRTFAHRPAG